MADINVQPSAPAKPPESQACDAGARIDIADATVMEGHEGVRLGSHVGKGRDACRVVQFGLQFLDASLGVRAFILSGGSPEERGSLNKGGMDLIRERC
jgi:hypothetical protein